MPTVRLSQDLGPDGQGEFSHGKKASPFAHWAWRSCWCKTRLAETCMQRPMKSSRIFWDLYHALFMLWSFNQEGEGTLTWPVEGWDRLAQVCRHDMLSHKSERVEKWKGVKCQACKIIKCLCCKGTSFVKQRFFAFRTRALLYPCLSLLSISFSRLTTKLYLPLPSRPTLTYHFRPNMRHN